MEFKKLPTNSRKLLEKIVSSESPEAYIRKIVMKASPEDRDKIVAVLDELRAKEYIKVEGSYLDPQKVVISNSARTYEEQLTENEPQNRKDNGPSITIGDNNRIKNSTISISRSTSSQEKKNFFKDHPIVCGVIISVIAAFIMMFSFWKQIVAFIERLFS